MPSTATAILDGLSTSVAVKAPCRTVAISNITLSGLQTISGYTTIEDDRVLVKGQTNAVDNGIYMASTGSWTRAKDADGNRDLVQGTLVLVRSAVADGNLWELTTANPIVIGTTALTFELRDDPAITYDQTEAEIAAGVTPTNYAFIAGNPRRQGAPIDGTTSARAAFAAQDSTGEQVYVTRGTYLIDSNITLTSNYTFERGAILKIATGVTLLFTQPSTEKWADAQQIFQIVGTGKVQWSACSPTVLPEWWTTNTTPATTDMTTALQRAGDCVVNGADAYVPAKTTGGAGRLTMKLTTKRYRTTAALDWNQRDYLHIISVGKSEILSESATYIADFSSTYRLHVESVDFISYSASTGLLFNRCTDNPYCLYVRMDNVNVFVDTDTAANSGQGTYGVVNCRAEQNVWINCDIRADVFLYMTQDDDANFPPLSGTQDTAITSLVSGTFISCNFLRHTKHNYGAILYGVLDIHFINCYWATVSTASGSNPYAFFVDTISGCTFTGVMEGTERFMFFSKTSYFLKINVTPQAVALDSGGLLNFDSSNATGLVNSEVTFNITSAISGGKVIRWGGGGPSFQLFGVTIRTGDTSLIEAVSASPTNASICGVDVITNQTTIPTVASAAALSLPIGAKMVFVSGTTSITSIGATGFEGCSVIFIFQGALTLTDTGNIKAGGNFLTTADDAIQFACAGGNWYQTGPGSAN